MTGRGKARRVLCALVSMALLAVVAAAATAAQPAPTITGFSPTSGLPGAPVTINGTNLEGATALKIGAVAAPISTDSTTSITTAIPAGATAGVVNVATPGGKATSTRAIDILAVSSFAPTSGPYGTVVTITGSGFTSTSSVAIGGVSASVIQRTATTLQFIWPEAAASGAISVTNTAAPSGTVTSSGSFTVTAHVAPSVTSFNPSSGVTGSLVTIMGSNFAGVSSVNFGNHAAPSFTVVSATEITAVVPSGAIPAAVAARNGAGSGTSSTPFDPTLSITGMTPAAAPAGSSVTLSGNGFTSTSTVLFDGTPATVTSRTPPHRIVVTVPAAAPSGPVSVTTSAGSAQTLGSFNPEVCGTASSPPTYTHVIVIMEENHSFSDIIGSPSAAYINALASQCGLATNYRSITHPSLPEYMAATSGLAPNQLAPFISDCVPGPSCESAANNLFNEAPSWKGYAESMPSNCSKADSGPYAPRHNPAVYYTDLANCSTNDVPLGTTSSSPLLSDFGSDATAPSVAWVTPNLCDDMHGGSGCTTGLALISAGDTWLKQWLPRITATPVYQQGTTAIFVVWDEGEGPDSVGGERCSTSADPSCQVPAIVVAPSVKTATKSAAAFNHYSLLRTIGDLLGLPRLGSASTAASMAAAFDL